MAADSRDAGNETGEQEGSEGSSSQNGKSSPGLPQNPQSEPQQKRVPTNVFLAAIEDFSMIYFTVCMNSGICGIILHLLPYQFAGAQIISDIFFVVDVLLFVIFTVFTIIRLVLFPCSVWNSIRHDLDELCFWAAAPIAWMTISALTGLRISVSYWGGHAWTVVAVVFWWLGAAWITITAIFSFFLIFKGDITSDRTLTPVPFLPPVGLATQASTGGLIINYSYAMSARLSVPMIISGYFFVGFAIFVGLIIYILYAHRLMACGLPPAAKKPGMMMLLGPVGQSATALQLLGTAANTKMDFAEYGRGTFLRASAASGLDAAGVLFAFLFLGFAYFWFLIVICVLVEGTFKREFTYTLVWWSTIFPAATVCTAWLALSTAMDSPAFRVLTTALYLLLVIDYLLNLGFTVWGVFFGKLFFKRTKADLMRQRQEQEKVS